MPILVALVAVIAVAGAAFAVVPKVMGPNATPTRVTHTFRGTITLWKGASGSWTTCSGTGGYSDLSEGGNVRITNGAGDVTTFDTRCPL